MIAPGPNVAASLGPAAPASVHPERRDLSCSASAAEPPDTGDGFAGMLARSQGTDAASSGHGGRGEVRLMPDASAIVGAPVTPALDAGLAPFPAQASTSDNAMARQAARSLSFATSDAVPVDVAAAGVDEADERIVVGQQTWFAAWMALPWADAEPTLPQSAEADRVLPGEGARGERVPAETGGEISGTARDITVLAVPASPPGGPAAVVADPWRPPGFQPPLEASDLSPRMPGAPLPGSGRAAIAAPVMEVQVELHHAIAAAPGAPRTAAARLLPAGEQRTPAPAGLGPGEPFIVEQPTGLASIKPAARVASAGGRDAPWPAPGGRGPGAEAEMSSSGGTSPSGPDLPDSDASGMPGAQLRGSFDEGASRIDGGIDRPAQPVLARTREVQARSGSNAADDLAGATSVNPGEIRSQVFGAVRELAGASSPGEDRQLSRPASPGTGAPLADQAHGSSDATRSMRIGLRPVELGHVDVRLTLRAGVLDVRLTCEREQTCAALQSGGAELADLLSSMGLSVDARGIEVQRSATADQARSTLDVRAQSEWAGDASGQPYAGDGGRRQGGRSMPGDDRPAGRATKGVSDASEDARPSKSASVFV